MPVIQNAVEFVSHVCWQLLLVDQIINDRIRFMEERVPIKANVTWQSLVRFKTGDGLERWASYVDEMSKCYLERGRSL